MKKNLGVEGMEGLKVIESSIVPIYEDSEALALSHPAFEELAERSRLRPGIHPVCRPHSDG
jgi:CRP-like cAMP-binding protein